MKLKQKVAVITGGSRGIGAAIARQLAQAGASVAIIYHRQQEQAQQVVAAIQDAGGHAAAFAADVSDETAVQQAIGQIIAQFGQIDILVNNAGMLEMRSLAEIDAEHIARQFNVNVNSVVYLTQQALPYFPLNNGRIINISSNLVYQSKPDSAIYSASKAAVSALTRVFAGELGPRGITVNAVAPSMTQTDMTAAMPAASRQQVIDATPLGRIGVPEDIAKVVEFLASEDAGWITGRTLLTDGGLVHGW
ncbi:dehydrogenase [Chromobacterium sp. LK11]|uniref:SDR family NAD(P)-dependent oxidoreductase n=1 Tax=Chromobacterium sp. LK11 TaxID=1628212 RepID=UPI000652CD0A|nr:glucose 1-dehydrogenase [Chromobacterium sp. LK11]KMN76195.1 dehydrogenase [Chromobacterium sp. LK11]